MLIFTLEIQYFYEFTIVDPIEENTVMAWSVQPLHFSKDSTLLLKNLVQPYVLKRMAVPNPTKEVLCTGRISNDLTSLQELIILQTDPIETPIAPLDSPEQAMWDKGRVLIGILSHKWRLK